MNVLGKYRSLKLLTTEVYDEVPTQFGRKYFGTDWMNEFKKEETVMGMRQFGQVSLYLFVDRRFKNLKDLKC